MRAIKTILHPTDFSPHSLYAFRIAVGLAREEKAQLVVLHVTPISHPDVRHPAPPELEPPAAAEEELKAYRREMEVRLERLRGPIGKLPVEHIIKEGPVGPTILAVADGLPADLIVMGTHGRRGEAKWMLGSVADDVLRKCKCPVLTVKLPA